MQPDKSGIMLPTLHFKYYDLLLIDHLEIRAEPGASTSQASGIFHMRYQQAKKGKAEAINRSSAFLAHVEL